MKNLNFRFTGQSTKKFVVASSFAMAFASCAPAVEKPAAAPVPSASAAPVVETPEQAPVEAAPEQKKSGYNADANPFELDERLSAIASAIAKGKGNDKAKVQKFFDFFKASSPNGVIYKDGLSRAPRTATETFTQGGDCSDMSNLALGVLSKMKTEGRMKIMHICSA